MKILVFNILIYLFIFQTSSIEGKWTCCESKQYGISIKANICDDVEINSNQIMVKLSKKIEIYEYVRSENEITLTKKPGDFFHHNKLKINLKHDIHSEVLEISDKDNRIVVLRR